VRDFVQWEPDHTAFCVLCKTERGGADPPGPWQRHYGSARRRLPIFGEAGSILGYFTYVAL
jgi:hypothetical protein